MKLLIVDVDNILTDGRIILDSLGRPVKSFDVQDGFGLVLARKAGLKLAIITAEKSNVVKVRAKQLKITWVAQRALDKLSAYRDCLAHFKVPPSAVCYIGDDLLDLPVLTRVGFSATIPGARPEVKTRVHFVTRAHGGRGAVRELVEFILKAQGRWEGIVRGYLS